MACHFLWHGYTCMVGKEEVEVEPRIFRNVKSDSLGNIWLTENFKRFRDEADGKEYSPCWNCNQG